MGRALPTPARPAPEGFHAERRSHAAIPLALVLLGAGLILGRYAVAIPFVLGLILFVVVLSFVGMRVNPFATGFYVSRKPSWAAIGVVFLSMLILFVGSYFLFVTAHAPVVPVPLP